MHQPHCVVFGPNAILFQLEVRNPFVPTKMHIKIIVNIQSAIVGTALHQIDVFTRGK